MATPAAVTEWASQLAALPISASLRASAWAYPIVEIFHLAGMALLFGSIVVVDMRLAGFGRQLPVTVLLRHALPLSVFGFLLIAGSGALLFLAHADDLVGNRAFLVKTLLVLLGLANAAWFHMGPYRALLRPGSQWEAGGVPPAGARLCAWISLVTWVLVICAGRLIAYM
ncbi:hypothetical protein [Cupriavidus plantarum]|uniref:Uncharacterized protein n=1 Tax=Cupriavidus plantarum TaxID=942865 RepID=A0A316ESA7_9BURK|nr:hypothetical protein [Cupriavidus plantarum]PWK35347.1 hypothetical protein C7419_102625 [Cupriavidus plantarum]REE93801.1 hypothetical protein C7418_2573 [Cupriavidus plantarum]RLK39212.1 hypothetical protein C7417_2745 [Cupriavidus plantarum]CAG2134728.1 hypothetical protein LMG26296_02073 [Cupriavidus plantarum]SMR84457.1 hypothetical protein SAMN05421735_3244 [Cupriavidus plantarum]